MRRTLVAQSAAPLLAGTQMFARFFDSDNDGITDWKDACSAIPVGAGVDGDHDGINDAIDKCADSLKDRPETHRIREVVLDGPGDRIVEEIGVRRSWVPTNSPSSRKPER